MMESVSELIFWLTLQQPNDACAFCPPFFLILPGTARFLFQYLIVIVQENAKFYHNSTRNVCKGLTHSFLK